MATTEEYKNGGSASYSFSIEYIKAEDIKVKVDGTALTYTATNPPAQTTEYTVNGSNVIFKQASVSGSTNGGVRIYRQTELGNSDSVTFQAGSSIRASDLNANHKLVKFSAQEKNDQKVTEDDIIDGAVTSAKIRDNTIVNADINASAAIDNSKIADGLLKSGLTVNSANIVDGSIVNADINASANIQGSKLANDSVALTKLGGGTLPSDITVTSTNIQNGTIVDEDIATGTLDNRYYTETELNNGQLDNQYYTESELNAGQLDTRYYTETELDGGALDPRYYTETELNSGQLNNLYYTETELDGGQLDNRYFTETESDARYFRQDSTETIASGDTWSASDAKVATTGAIDLRVIDLVDDVGGFTPIANETSFPTANPDVNNGTGTIVSVKAASTNLVPSSGTVTIANGAGTGNTVTLTGVTSTIPSGYGFLVETTTTLHTYTFHRLVPKATEVSTIAANAVNIAAAGANVQDIHNFADLYQISTSAPTKRADNSNLVDGDLWYDSSSNKVLMIYDGSSGDGFTAATPNASDLANIAIVAGQIVFTEDLGLITNAVATATGNTTLNTVAGIATEAATVAGIASDVTAVANNATNINAVAADAADIGAVAGKATEIGLLGTTDVIADMNTLGTSAIVTDMDTLADISSNITTVANNDSNVTAVAGNASNINAAVSNASNINAAVSNASNITTVAGNSTNINTVAGIDSNVTTVAGIASNVSTVAGNNADISTVAGNNANITTVAGANSNISTVAGSIANVNTAASNVTNINNFANRYRIASSDPGSSNDEGDLYFNTTSNELRVYNGSTWQGGVTATGNLAGLGANTFTGAQTFASGQTFDGRDVSADGAKLDAITTSSGAILNGVTATTQSASDNSTKIATTAYTDTAIANLVDSSPSALNTLNELAAAIGDDANFSTTITNSIATKLPLAGGTLTGTLTSRAIRPSANNSYDLGASDAQWNDLYIGNNIYLPDAGEVRLGNSGDLQLYHDGNNSVINDTGTGRLKLISSNVQIRNAANTETIAEFIQDGAVQLFNNNSKKFETTSSGATVTGTCTATTFSGSGASLSSLNASNISSGTISAARVPTLNQNTTGSSGSCTGNAATASQAANAALLDNIDSSQFVRSDANDTMNGNYTITGSGDQKLALNGTDPYIRWQEGGTNKAYIQWNSAGFLHIANQETDEHLKIANGTTGLIFRTGGSDYTVWHRANHGSGSGLDADLLDGVQGSNYMGRASNGSHWNANNWLEFGTGDHGLYYPNNYAYHVYLSGQYLRIQNNTTSNGIKVYCNGADRGWVYATDNNNIGFLDETGNWSLKTQRGANSCTLYDQHFYTDTNDTYNIGSSSTRWNHVYAKYLHFGSSSRYLGPVTGDYGSVQVNGEGSNNWEGFSIDGRAVFMHDGNVSTGLYNDVHNQWFIHCTHNGTVKLYHSGSARAETSSSGFYVHGTITATSNITAYSDARLKKNVKTIDNALDIVDQLRGVSFDWKEDDKHSIGVIAQEVEEVLPEIVVEDEKEVKTVDYGKMVGVLINAIKELRAEVKELKGGK